MTDASLTEADRILLAETILARVGELLDEMTATLDRPAG